MAKVASLKELVKNKDLVLVFRNFLHDVYNSENLAFWFEIEEYRSVSISQDARNLRGQELMKKYFSPVSQYELNVDSKIRNELEALSKKGVFTVDTFDKAQSQIWNVMEMDCFPKFMASKSFQEGVAKATPRKNLQPLERHSTLNTIDSYYKKK